jgi:hypothetical protein
MIHDTMPAGAQFITQTNFAKQHGGLTLSAIDYLIRMDKLDAFRMGTTRYIIVNEKSKRYKPNKKRPKEVK